MTVNGSLYTVDGTLWAMYDLADKSGGGGQA